MPCAAPRPRARRSLHKRPAGQPAAAANSLKARPCPDRAPRRAHSHTRTRLHDGCRGLRLQARARCGCQKFAGHQSEHGLGATPAPRWGVPGSLGLPRDVLSLGHYACGLNLDDGASRVFGFFGSRTALVGVAGRRAVLPAGISGRVRLELRFLGRPRLGTTSRAQSILRPLRVFSSTVTAGAPGELSSLPSAPGLQVARAEKSGSASKACALNIKERFLDAARRRYKFGHTTTRKPCI